MKYGPTLGALVTLAVTVGLASSAVAAPQQHLVNAATTEATHGPTINGTAEVTAAPTPKASGGVVAHGPTINGTDEVTAAPTPKDPAADGDNTPWALAVIGTVVALGLIGLAISRARSRTRTSPAALSQ